MLSSWSDLAFVVVHVLCLGLTLPVLSAFGLRLRPFGVVPRWRHVEATAADLGVLWQPGAIVPGSRQANGFADLFTLILTIALVILVVGCATLATLVIRRGWERRDELAVRTAMGATRGALRRDVFGDWLALLAIGTASGVGLGKLIDCSAVPQGRGGKSSEGKGGHRGKG